MAMTRARSQADLSSPWYRMMVEMGRDRYIVPSPQVMDVPLTDGKDVPLTRTIQWSADSIDPRHPSQVQFFFPIFMMVQWEEFDFISPSEWDVCFVGPRKSVSSALANIVARVVPSFLNVHQEGWLALLHVNHDLVGLNGVLLSQFFFPAKLARLGVEGRIISPLEWEYLPFFR